MSELKESSRPVAREEISTYSGKKKVENKRKKSGRVGEVYKPLLSHLKHSLERLAEFMQPLANEMIQVKVSLHV